MDTRDKIVRFEDLASRLGDGRWLGIVGLFDPMTSQQAKRIAGLKSDRASILAIVEEISGTLLPAEARAALVAALRDVALVVISPRAAWQTALSKLPQVEIVNDEAGEHDRTAQFVKHVRSRPQAKP